MMMRILTCAAALLLSGAANAAVLTEDFEAPFPAWESGWFGANSNARNYYPDSADRGNNPDGLWVCAVDQPCTGNESFTINFSGAFAQSLTSLFIDVAAYQPTILTFFDQDGGVLAAYDVVLTFGALTDPGVYSNYGVVSTNGIGGFSFSGLATGNTSIDNLVANGTIVPEPASWALLIAGFGMVGATMRRRRTVIA